MDRWLVRQLTNYPPDIMIEKWIYDGYPEQVREYKMKTKMDFEQGLKHYFAKEFLEAAGCFKHVLNINPEDKTARLYLERSAQFMVHGVPDGWLGVEVLESK